MKISYLLLTLVFLVSCQTEPKKEASIPTAQKETPTPPPAPVKAVDLWTPFWKTFQTAVVEGDVETLVRHIDFPLKGSEPFNNGKQISKATFHQHFSKIFDVTARKTFKETDNMSEFNTKKQKIAKQLNVPANKKIRTVMVLYVENKGKQNQTESSVTFQFVAKNPGEFKLYSLVAAG